MGWAGPPLPFFRPEFGHLLMCDFVGFRVPEMVKRRMVVVVSPTIKGKPLCIVVPLSTQRPDRIEPFHHRMSEGPVPAWGKPKVSWVKCDMIYTVALWRLDRIKSPEGFVAPKLPDEEMTSIRRCILHALGFGRLTSHL